MGLDSNDFLEDYTTDEFKEKAAKAVEEQTMEQQKTKAIEDRKMEADAALAEANVVFNNSQTHPTHHVGCVWRWVTRTERAGPRYGYKTRGWRSSRY